MNSRPNILLITGDHMRHDALACNLDSKSSTSLAQVIKTPNFDKLAEEGITFLNSFTPNPICIPARAAITTGLYPHKCTGTKNNAGRIHEGHIKMAEYFADHGYRTYAVGKLHYVPYSPPGAPRLLHGFQHAELCEEGRIVGQFDPDGKTAGLEDYHDFLKTVGWGGYERAHGIGNNDVHPALSPLPLQYHEESWVADRSVANIEKHLSENPGQPFLIWTSFTKPHSPYDPPEPYHKMYDPRKVPVPAGAENGDELLLNCDKELFARKQIFAWDKLSLQALQVIRAYYCGMVSFQDAMIGRIIDFLDAKGIIDNTIIVYSADHGDLLGDFGRFFKTCMFDGAVKVPLLIRADFLKNDHTHRRDHLVGLQDIFPTLVSLAGIPAPENLDGIDLTPILRNPDLPGREFYISQTLDSPRQKYMIRTAEWKYIYCETGGTEELYYVPGDDSELLNLAKAPEYAGVLNRMRSKLANWCQENGDLGMLDGDGLKSSMTDFKPAFDHTLLGWRKY